MIIWQGLDDIHEELEGSVVTIGVFDGVHRGHRRLINTAVGTAGELDVPSILMTFDPHPTAVFAPERTPTLLTTVRERTLLCAELGVDAILVIDFNRELAGLDPEEYFVQVLMDKLKARHVVVGENFTFGRDAAGTAETMVELGQKYGVGVTIVELLHDGPERVCSSNVRRHLADGDISEANDMLGRIYQLTAKVTRGAGRGGAELGYPTANMYFPESIAVPADGVYAGWFTVLDEVPLEGDMEPGLSYPAAISVGTNPTFGDHERSVESFILDRTANLYGRVATVSFVEKIRDMIKFNSVEELLENMARDVARTREVLVDAPRPQRHTY